MSVTIPEASSTSDARDVAAAALLPPAPTRLHRVKAGSVNVTTEVSQCAVIYIFKRPGVVWCGIVGFYVPLDTL